MDQQQGLDLNIPGGSTTATDAAAKTVTISGVPTGTVLKSYTRNYLSNSNAWHFVRLQPFSNTRLYIN